MKRAFVIVAAVLILAGCASEPEPESSRGPEPTVVEYATENQVASVIAEYEPKWREVIEESTECRFLWVLGGSTIAEEIHGDVCFMQEKTIGITAQLVLRDWEALNVPESLQSLVTDTSTVLREIGRGDLKTICGEASRPVETDECNSELAGRNMLYSQLESSLNKWSPYL
ncbi:hypothetical protein [Homoserinimonas aerilata]|uniref:hypothetical protein n=1 Tax=Homoserinimonas aerilata TaxID=1162970 RepID=UPI0011548D39|nr:hypothetical protein [Homoserinimonas aerilata]